MNVITPMPGPGVEVVDFDFYDIEPVGGDIQLGWKRLHDGPDIFYTPRNGGHYVFTRAEDIYNAYRDVEHFSSDFNTLPKEVNRKLKLIPTQSDPPEHGDYRLLVASMFTPAAVRSFEARARELTRELIERFRNRRHCEFVSQFAEQMPIAMFLLMMDLPFEDAKGLAPAVEAMCRSRDESETLAAAQAMFDYLQARIDERRAQPGEDMISRLVHGQWHGRPLSAHELLGLGGNLMFAGLDTVTSAMSFMMRFLALNPVERKRLVDDPAVIPMAVEELLRRYGIGNLARVVAKPFAYKGVPLRQGDMVMLPLTLYGLDERRFPDPLRVDFNREDVAHITFGVGPHRCLGSHIARMELRVMLEEWLPRIPDFELADPSTIVAKTGNLNAIKLLALRW